MSLAHRISIFPDAEAVARALAGRVADALEEKPSLVLGLPTGRTPLLLYDELARLADLSRYQLIRAFRHVTGMPPHAWRLNQRINLARTWIRQGVGLSEVALRLGFADQAHFQRVFKAHAGVTPGRFRA